MSWDWFWVLSALLVGYWLGWNQAHKIVARECERLGAFYVGDAVYECHKVDTRHEKIRRQQ